MIKRTALDYTIALAQPQHVEALAGIGLSAATLLEGHAPVSVLEETTPEDIFRRVQQEGRLWVTLVDEIPVGFALVEMLAEDFPHLQEMDVHPHHGRRRLGTALLRGVLEWLARSGHRQITLTTFRTVPWICLSMLGSASKKSIPTSCDLSLWQSFEMKRIAGWIPPSAW